MIKRKLTDEQRRENLDKLATYLESLPTDYQYFSMYDYVNRRYDMEQTIDIEQYLRKNGGIHTCGSVGCAVGHGPSAGILFTDEDFGGLFLSEHHPNWDNYVRNFVESDGTDEFDWMFSMDWRLVDDTHLGAAARIRYYLANGLPESFTCNRIDSDDWEGEHYGEYLVNKGESE